MRSCVKSDFVINEKSVQKNCLKQSENTLFEILFCFSFYYRKNALTESDIVFLSERGTEAISLPPKSLERVETSLTSVWKNIGNWTRLP